MRSCLRGLGLVCLVLAPLSVAGQSDGNPSSASIGGTLGALSGGTLALTGSLAPCNLVMESGRCTRVATGFGMVVAAASGAVLSYHDRDALRRRLWGGGIGALAGVATGAALRLRFRQIDWRDVGAVAAVGAAIGTAPEGAALGLGVGAALGAVVWLAVPGRGLPDAAALAVVGMAVGGLAHWVHGAATSGGDSAGMRAQFTIVL